MKKLGLFILSFCLLFSGCSIANYLATKAGYKAVEVANKELIEANTKYDNDMKALEKRINDANQTKWDQFVSNFQHSSDFSYASYIAAQLNQRLHPSRMADILFYDANGSFKYGLAPSVQTIMAKNEELVTMLDEQKTTNQQMQDKLDKVNSDAKIAQDKLKENDNNINKLKQEKETLKTQDEAKIKNAQNNLTKAQNKVIAAQAKDIENEEKEKALKSKIIWSLMGLAALFAVGAVYGPLNYKLESGLGVIGCVGLSILTAYIEMWMIFLAFIIIIAALGLSYYLKHHQETKLNTSLVGAIQDVKTEANDVYNSTVKPKLKDWMKDSPKLVTAVNDKLIQMNLINKSDLTTSNPSQTT